MSYFSSTYEMIILLQCSKIKLDGENSNHTKVSNPLIAESVQIEDN